MMFSVSEFRFDLVCSEEENFPGGRKPVEEGNRRSGEDVERKSEPSGSQLRDGVWSASAVIAVAAELEA
jgi:hypothetical protein